MKKIKILMIVCVIIIITIICAFFILKINKSNPKIIMQDEEAMGVGEFQEEIIEQINYSEWFQVEQCINEYLNSINKNSSSYYGRDENNNYIKIVKDNDIKSKIYNLLSKNYIEQNNIIVDEVFDYIEDIKEKQIYTILSIKKVISNNSNQYITTGVIEENNEIKQEKTFIVNFNLQDGDFSIEPIRNGVDVDNLKVSDVVIEKNDYNAIPTVEASVENIVGKYFTFIKKMMLMYPEKLYEYFDEEYKNKRFENFKEYKSYIEKNRKELEGIQFTKYLINNYEDYTQLVGQDQYGNLYIFNEESVMNFTFKLDTYTIPTEKFITTYQSSNEEKKVMMNIDKWVQMLNRRDYKTAYQVLDETFRKNNFGTEEAFENYMREYFPLHYKIEYGDSTEQNGIYTQDIILEDISNSDQNTIQKTIIMQLKDDYNFAMSFNV